MCNCGKKRTELKQQQVGLNNTSVETMSLKMQKYTPVLFEYTGNTALTVTGRSTRKNYRFNFNGDKQFVEYNDAAAITAIPVLKKTT